MVSAVICLFLINCIAHWPKTQFLEGHRSAELCSNHNQTPDPANQALQDHERLPSRCELNSTELWSSGTEFETTGMHRSIGEHFKIFI